MMELGVNDPDYPDWTQLQERQNHEMHVRTGNSLKTNGCDSRLGKC